MHSLLLFPLPDWEQSASSAAASAAWHGASWTQAAPGLLPCRGRGQRHPDWGLGRVCQDEAATELPGCPGVETGILTVGVLTACWALNSTSTYAATQAKLRYLSGDLDLGLSMQVEQTQGIKDYIKHFST